MTPSALSLEQHLIEPDRWDREVPPEVRIHGIEDEVVRYPTGYGRHPELGWFVLSTGQGPFVVWAEWQEKPLKSHGFEVSYDEPRYKRGLLFALTRLQKALQETEP